MIKFDNNFTTPEQSRVLLKLGVPTDSADCYFTEGGSLHRINDDNLFRDEFFEFYGKHYGYTPCWSVGRLIEIIGICANIDSFEVNVMILLVISSV